MKNILMLALAPIRKNKGQTISLFVFVLITVMILNIGLVLFFGINNFFDKRAELNHAPHFTGVYYSVSDSITQGQTFMENDARVSEIEKINAVGGMGDYVINDVNTLSFLIFSCFDEAQKMDAPSFIGEHLPLTGNRIYIPNIIFLSGEFNIGDDFKMLLSGTELSFTIAGTTEEFTFGTKTNSISRFYISEEKYNEIKGQFPNNGLTILSARLNNGDDLIFFQTDYNKEISSDGLFNTVSYNSAKQARIMIPSIIAIIITAFAIVLLAVSLIVIRFRIANGIEESMTNIGVQKAMGYRNVQIVAASVTQYCIVALAGGFIGAILAGFVIPVITKIFEPLIALAWNPGVDINTSLVSILLVLLTVVLIAFMTSCKIRKLHPLTALRGGTATHSFKKNSFPLDKSRGSLNLLLAFKQIFQNKKQAVAISVIVAAITMASTASIALNYSMNDGREIFAHSVFGEMAICDASFMLKSSDDGEAFKGRILKYPEVRKVLAFQMSGISLLIDEVKAVTLVTEDCLLMEGQMLIEGYYPKYDNEIALGTSISKATGKNVGDTVRIRLDDKENDYIVTGIIQAMQSNGFIGLLTTAGMHEVMPEFMFSEFLVYANEGTDVESLIERIKSSEGDIFDTIVNTNDQISTLLDSMGGMFMTATYGIVAVTVFVVVLTLYVVIKTTVLRRRRELGIQKAVGFTTWQLMNQIALNMTPIILLGVAIGAVAGYFGFNPLTAMLISGMGVAKINLPVPLDQIIVVCIAIAVLAYAVSMLIAWRIRKISAYSLVSE